MNELLSNYTILGRLGSQTKRKFGEVFLIQDKTTNKRAVAKTISKNSNNCHLAERLVREASFNFKHQGLPKIIKLIETNESVILIKEYSNGIPLNEYWKKIKRKDQLSEWKKIIHSLVNQFEILHKEKIVHCDIKPSNIIIEETIEGFQTHLIDFGMALRLNENFKPKTLFPLGFAAPELVLNEYSCIDHTTDLYALGIVSWVLFTGKLPLSHPNPSIFTNLQITHPLPDNNKLPKGLYDLLLKMCYKHSFSLPPNKLNHEDVVQFLQAANKKRFQTISEFISEMENLKSTNRFLGIQL